MTYISIIVPIYHGKRYIKSLIEQVEDCKHYLSNNINVELVLSNDAPEDKLEENYYSKCIDVVVMNTEINRGIHGARVQGLEACKGEYVVFLDQDDLIESKYLLSQISKIKDADAVVCKAIHDKKQKYDSIVSFQNAITKGHMLSEGNGIVSPGQVLIRKSAISEIWEKNILTFNGADDWLLWICMMSENKIFVLNEDILYEHVVNGENMSWQTEKMLYSEQEIVKIIEENNVLNKEDLITLKKTIQSINIQRIRMMDKFRKMFLIYDSWMSINNRGYSISDYLQKKNLKKIAIYGRGYLGKQLYAELKSKNIKVEYFVDKNAMYLDCEIPIYAPEYNLPLVDTVIITLTEGEMEVVDKLEKKLGVKCYVIKNLIKEINMLF